MQSLGSNLKWQDIKTRKELKLTKSSPNNSVMMQLMHVSRPSDIKTRWIIHKPPSSRVLTSQSSRRHLLHLLVPASLCRQDLTLPSSERHLFHPVTPASPSAPTCRCRPGSESATSTASTTVNASSYVFPSMWRSSNKLSAASSFSAANITRKSAIVEKWADRTSPGIAPLCCWRWLFQTCHLVWGSTVCSIIKIYSPYGTNVYGSRGGEFVRGQSRCRAFKVVKLCSQWGSAFSLLQLYTRAQSLNMNSQCKWWI